MASVYPFYAIVFQDEMKLAILVAAVEPHIGGVLVLGDRGTGKSTAARALAALLPAIQVLAACRYGCDAADKGSHCAGCTTLKAGGRPKTRLAPVPMVDPPLGAVHRSGHRPCRRCRGRRAERARTVGWLREGPSWLHHGRSRSVTAARQCWHVQAWPAPAAGQPTARLFGGDCRAHGGNLRSSVTPSVTQHPWRRVAPSVLHFGFETAE